MAAPRASAARAVTEAIRLWRSGLRPRGPERTGRPVGRFPAIRFVGPVRPSPHPHDDTEPRASLRLGVLARRASLPKALRNRVAVVGQSIADVSFARARGTSSPGT
nr:MAG: hypothetical protein DIU78_05815 [Pseudomonadota bacterium]